MTNFTETVSINNIDIQIKRTKNYGFEISTSDYHKLIEDMEHLNYFDVVGFNGSQDAMKAQLDKVDDNTVFIMLEKNEEFEHCLQMDYMRLRKILIDDVSCFAYFSANPPEVTFDALDESSSVISVNGRLSYELLKRARVDKLELKIPTFTISGVQSKKLASLKKVVLNDMAYSVIDSTLFVSDMASLVLYLQRLTSVTVSAFDNIVELAEYSLEEILPQISEKKLLKDYAKILDRIESINNEEENCEYDVRHIAETRCLFQSIYQYLLSKGVSFTFDNLKAFLIHYLNESPNKSNLLDIESVLQELDFDIEYRVLDSQLPLGKYEIAVTYGDLNHGQVYKPKWVVDSREEAELIDQILRNQSTYDKLPLHLQEKYELLYAYDKSLSRYNELDHYHKHHIQYYDMDGKIYDVIFK